MIGRTTLQIVHRAYFKYISNPKQLMAKHNHDIESIEASAIFQALNSPATSDSSSSIPAAAPILPAPVSQPIAQPIAVQQPTVPVAPQPAPAVAPQPAPAVAQVIRSTAPIVQNPLLSQPSKNIPSTTLPTSSPSPSTSSESRESPSQLGDTQHAIPSITQASPSPSLTLASTHSQTLPSPSSTPAASTHSQTLPSVVKPSPSIVKTFPSVTSTFSAKFIIPSSTQTTQIAATATSYNFALPHYAKDRITYNKIAPIENAKKKYPIKHPDTVKNSKESFSKLISSNSTPIIIISLIVMTIIMTFVLIVFRKKQRKLQAKSDQMTSQVMDSFYSQSIKEKHHSTSTTSVANKPETFWDIESVPSISEYQQRNAAASNHSSRFVESDVSFSYANESFTSINNINSNIIKDSMMCSNAAVSKGTGSEVYSELSSSYSFLKNEDECITDPKYSMF